MNALLERLYDLLYEFRAYAILSGLVALSMLLMMLNDNPQVKRIRSISTVMFGMVDNQLSFIPTYFGLRSENELLRRINIELADETQRLREAKLEDMRLKQLLGIKSEIPYPLIAGRIVNKNLLLLRNTLTLDIGTVDGVQLHMPVVSDGGLVGLITNVSDHYAMVNLLLNVDFRVSAKIQRSRVDGIVAWDGRSLVLKNVPKMRDIKVGDVVATSEYSSTFPADIRIGLVNDVRDQTTSLFKSITITPGVDFVRLEEVFVMKYVPDTERLTLEQQPIVKPFK